MSCEHGNWPPCELCDALDAAHERGFAAGKLAAYAAPQADQQGASLEGGLSARMVKLAEKWEKNAEVHGVRTFTGNDHKLFANELLAAIKGDSQC